MNAILSLLQPLDRYRAPSAIGSAIGRPLSRPISHPRTGRSPQPPRSKPLRGAQPRDSGAIVPQTPLKQARNENAIEAAILNRVLDRDWSLNRRGPLSKRSWIHSFSQIFPYWPKCPNFWNHRSGLKKTKPFRFPLLKSVVLDFFMVSSFVFLWSFTCQTLAVNARNCAKNTNQQEASISTITWCDLFRPKLAKKNTKSITLHDVLELLKQALSASRDVITSSQICDSKLQRVFTLGLQWRRKVTGALDGKSLEVKGALGNRVLREVLPRVLREVGVLPRVLPRVLLLLGRQQEEHSREHPQFPWPLSGAPPGALRFPRAPLLGSTSQSTSRDFPFSTPAQRTLPYQKYYDDTLRAQILKKFKILKFSSELEIFKRATHQTPIFCGEFWRSGLKISSEIENFKRDWNFQAILKFFKIWALRVAKIANYYGVVFLLRPPNLLRRGPFLEKKNVCNSQEDGVRTSCAAIVNHPAVLKILLRVVNFSTVGSFGCDWSSPLQH